jgi:1-phosphatidylinositol phosphodiesterase
MASISDDRRLSELSIPGTHDSGAYYEPFTGVAKCQALSIADQLAAGVRYFDLRCRNVGDQFLIYHGGVDQNQTYDELLATMYAFLDAHPTETVIASVKEEATPASPTLPFDARFAAYLATDPARWSTATTIPRLGEVRGKLVLLRRFPTTSPPLGIDASPWADNTTFTVTNAASLRIEDAYVVTDNTAKWSAVTALLAEARTPADPTTLFLAYTSGYQLMMGLPNIPSVAEDLDARIDALLADPANAEAHLGVLVMDFVTAARAKAIAATNAK